MTYPTSHHHTKFHAPPRLPDRWDFQIIGIALRMAKCCENHGERDAKFLQEYETLKKEAAKFMDRWGLDPQDFHK